MREALQQSSRKVGTECKMRVTHGESQFEKEEGAMVHSSSTWISTVARCVLVTISESTEVWQQSDTIEEMLPKKWGYKRVAMLGFASGDDRQCSASQ